MVIREIFYMKMLFDIIEFFVYQVIFELLKIGKKKQEMKKFYHNF